MSTPKGPEKALEAFGGDPERTICFCHNVPLGKLIEAVQSGSDTLDKIQAETCASTGCGGCESEVCEILRLMKE
jgi:NAD(P)H-nitrite reductase large subunit